MCPTIVPYAYEAKKEKRIYFTSLLKDMKVLVATEKPFAKKAVEGIRGIVEEAGYELALLEKYADRAELLSAVADVDALIVRSDKVTAEVIAAAKNLKIVVRAGAGYDNVDLEAASARGIVVMNTPGQNSNAVAELALAMMIFMARNGFTPGTGSEIQGKTLGIHAYGNVGKLVGRKGKAMGMNVIAYDPFVTDDALFEADGVKRAASVGELYEAADFLSLHIPATAQTRGSIGYELLMSMPKGATLVNTARKEVIDEAGVVRAMTEREDLKYITDIAPDAQAEMAGKFGKRHGQEDGCRDGRGQYQRRTGCGAADRRFLQDGRHPFPGQQVIRFTTGRNAACGSSFAPSFNFVRYGKNQTFPRNPPAEGTCCRGRFAALRRARLGGGQSRSERTFAAAHHQTRDRFRSDRR